MAAESCLRVRDVAIEAFHKLNYLGSMFICDASTPNQSQDCQCYGYSA